MTERLTIEQTDSKVFASFWSRLRRAKMYLGDKTVSGDDELRNLLHSTVTQVISAEVIPLSKQDVHWVIGDDGIPTHANEKQKATIEARVEEVFGKWIRILEQGRAQLTGAAEAPPGAD